MKPETQNQKLETYQGFICPGFINSHCHLELSHLKGQLSEGKGLPQFVREIVPKRRAAAEIIEQAIANAESEMIANGILGVGDICNTNQTFSQKAKGNIRYHNFIELLDLEENKAEDEFEKGISLAGELTNSQSQISNLKSQISLVPHAPYSVSPTLFKLIKDYAEANNSVLSIHNQETESENAMFVSAKGELLETMKSLIPVYEKWKATGKRSLAYTLENLLGENKILLVHNTYTTKEDLINVNKKQETRNKKLIYFCFCPNANLFIEKRSPDFHLFIDEGCKITVGTDSYASNWSLSILDELKIIHKHSPTIPLETLLKWATLNGAEFFGWDKEFGSIEKGKKPGLNLIDNVYPDKLQLSSKSAVRRIV